ncbi:MAG: type 4a pilus biogenesis protein PilO [Gemmatimonadales bacterium]
MADLSKSTPVMLTVIALLVGYVGYTGAGIDQIGMKGLQSRQQRVVLLTDTLTRLTAEIDTAKRDLAHGSVEDLRKRVDAYKASLGVLRTLVPEQREVNNLLDDIQIRAKVRGVTFSGFAPVAPEPGPAPYDTYTYKLSVIGHYHQVGQFLTDIASLRRIIVPGEVAIGAANQAQARALGDTTAMIEARFSIKTYVKARQLEDSTNAP